jgi:hypothetical protein
MKIFLRFRMIIIHFCLIGMKKSLVRDRMKVKKSKSDLW